MFALSGTATVRRGRLYTFHSYYGSSLGWLSQTIDDSLPSKSIRGFMCHKKQDITKVLLNGYLSNASMSLYIKLVVLKPDGTTIARDSDEYAPGNTDRFEIDWHIQDELTVERGDLVTIMVGSNSSSGTTFYYYFDGLIESRDQ